MNNRRRNLRGKSTKYKKIFSDKKTKILLYLIISIIVIGICIINIRNIMDKKELAKQRENLQKEIEAIYISDNENEENIEENKEDTYVSMIAVGDILCGNQILNDGYNKKEDTYNFDNIFSSIKRIVKNSDIAIGTMETNFINDKYQGKDKFNSPIEFAKAVKNSGINILATAQNHAFDYGYNGMVETETNLANIGFNTTGTKTSQEDTSYLIKKVKGIPIAFLSYTCEINNNNLTEEEKKAVNIFSEEKLKKDIELVKAEGAEFICTYMHWGDVNSNIVNQNQKDIVEILLKNNVDLILGTHPAVVQKMELRQNEKGKDVIIAYSLGNYISDFVYNNSNIELLLKIQLRKDNSTKEVYINKVTYVPIYVLDNGTKAKDRFQLIDMQGVAKQYSEGNTKIVSKDVYQKLIKGLDDLEKILK